MMTGIVYFCLLPHQAVLEHGPSLLILIGVSQRIFSGGLKQDHLSIEAIFLPDKIAPLQITILL